MAKRVLITGAAGFVGANLARKLIAGGHEVFLLVRPGSDRWRLDGVDAPILELDLTDPAGAETAVADARPDWVMHLAAHGAYSWQTDPQLITDVNVVGTVRLLEAAARAGVERFVNAGSSSEYGLRDHAPREDESAEPNSVYAAAKAAATSYCGFYARRRGLATVTLRLYSAYGPWEEAKRLIPALVREALGGGLPPLVDPEIARDFVYVDDVCEAFALAASHDSVEPGSVYNVASGTQTTLREIVEAARRVFGVEQEPEWGTMENRSWDTETWVGDPSRIREQLGWRPRVSLDRGLKLTADWVSGQPA